MISLKIFSATEARDNLFKLLKLVENRERVIIERKGDGARFLLTSYSEERHLDKKTILKQLAQTKLKSMSPEDIKRILDTKLDI